MAEPVLTIEHLKKEYDGQKVLDDVSLQVHQGEVIVIVGPSGSGKSTLLRCINALEEIQDGEIRLGTERMAEDRNGLPELRAVPAPYGDGQYPAGACQSAAQSEEGGDR